MMQESYKSRFKVHSTDTKRRNKVIAALICDINGQAHVAVISTGTHINYTSECKLERICDGHAESMCYEAAPIYFQEQMLNCSEDKSSIFTCVSKNKGCLYKLNPGVTFHLLVTEPPCGFIRENKAPYMWWKETKEHSLHIPTCSSRILINAHMGIQGYTSHLLEQCIFIKTITILFTDDNNLVKQTTTFDNEIVKMPKIRKMKYKPEGFNDDDVIQFQPMNLTPGCADSYDQQPEGHNVKGLQHSYVGLYTPNNQVGHIYFRYCSEKGEQIYHSGIKKSLREIDGKLRKNIDEHDATERQKLMKQRHFDLKSKLNLLHQLKTYSQILSPKITELKTKQNSKRMKLTTEMEKFLADLDYEMETGPIKEQIDDFRNNGLQLTKLKKANSDILTSLKDESLELVIIDCSWEAYFKSEVCPLSIEESTTDNDDNI